MRYINDIPNEKLKNVRVLLRAELNVSLQQKNIEDDLRIQRAAQTIRYLQEREAKVIIIAHIGRDTEESLEPVAESLKQLVPLTFVPDIVGFEARSAVGEMQGGDVVLLENLRQDPREKENDENFVRKLAALGDLYVNDAFPASHRKHASIVGVPGILPGYCGLTLRMEIEHLSKALTPPAPSLCILGGAKFDTKEPLIQRLIDIYDNIFISGALANDIFRAKGLEVGRSLVSDVSPSLELLTHPKVIAPVDVTAERPNKQAAVKRPEDVQSDEKIVDVGPDTIAAVKPFVDAAQFILWNGPMGLYEEGYGAWTDALADAVAKSRAHSIVGGGDTIASIQQQDLGNHVSFISTGGGAMIEFLINGGTLPGIEAIREVSIT